MSHVTLILIPMLLAVSSKMTIMFQSVIFSVVPSRCYIHYESVNVDLLDEKLGDECQPNFSFRFCFLLAWPVFEHSVRFWEPLNSYGYAHCGTVQPMSTLLDRIRT